MTPAYRRCLRNFTAMGSASISEKSRRDASVIRPLKPSRALQNCRPSQLCSLLGPVNVTFHPRAGVNQREVIGNGGSVKSDAIPARPDSVISEQVAV